MKTPFGLLEQGMRLFALMIALILTAGIPAYAAGGFASFIDGVRGEAAIKGISREIISEAFTGIRHNPRVIELDRKQPESRLTFAQYKKNVITQGRIDKGRALLREHRNELEKISREYGVPASVIIALWGMETSYGSNTGGFDIIEALATLAYDGRRSSFFRGELFNALQILDEGHIKAADMTGSWAGAMGQNQFMPSSFKAYAVDGNGDGRRDIWKTKADVFASTANYLSKSGWNSNERWGREVKLSQAIPKTLTGIDVQKLLTEWEHMGVRLPDGGRLPTDNGMYASLVVPDGANGKAYLVYKNYRVIMKWNRSVYFATSVGLLSDLIAKAE